MESTDKPSCRILAELLVAHGVERVVMSPGSRNMPLMVAIHRCQHLSSTVVVDERTAAFMAVGMAAVSMRPVAVVCTSGTALLNYAPAIAEAYYRHLPLIVISADRPAQWIDQDDSQTIRQHGALANIVKRSYDIPDYHAADHTACWFTNRLINDALSEATRGCPGPVHINIQLNEPLNGMTEAPLSQREKRVIATLPVKETLPDAYIRQLADIFSSSARVMIIAGFHQPDQALDAALSRIAEHPNVTILTESIANCHIPGAITGIDIAVGGIAPQVTELYRPDVVITFGGALVSRFVKQFIRSNPPRHHWHIGHTRVTVDCMQSLTMRVEISPAGFFSAIAESLNCHTVMESGYRNLWSELYKSRISRRDTMLATVPWCDLKAFSIILPAIPHNYNLQLSNGTTVRYAQLLADKTHTNRSDCNRGVSGIDGSTSTAIGAAMAYSGPTLLISGDTSAQYDMGALAVRDIPHDFRMIVLCNDGGGIFRFIRSTSALAEREVLFGEPVNFPVGSIAGSFGFKFYRASSADELQQQLPEFFSDCRGPAIMAVDHLPADESAGILTNLLNGI